MTQVQIHPIASLLEQQKQSIDHFFSNISSDEIEQALELCLKAKGLIIPTGVGKSGIVAEKMAMTLISTGTRSLYLPAANFLHGDIGGVCEDDVVLMLSKSGQTEELIALLPHLKRRGCKLIVLTANRSSVLAKEADCCVFLPVEQELCAFDLAPTISTTAQLMVGDLLAVSLMERKGFSLQEYAHNHPAGSIGFQLTKTVEHLMKTGANIPVCSPDDPLLNVIVELSNKQCGALLILDEKKHLLGIFTDGDLRRALQNEGPKALEKPLNELMSKEPITLNPDDLVYHAIEKMQHDKYVMVAPVVKAGVVVGIVRMHDMIHEGIS